MPKVCPLSDSEDRCEHHGPWLMSDRDVLGARWEREGICGAFQRPPPVSQLGLHLFSAPTELASSSHSRFLPLSRRAIPQTIRQMSYFQPPAELHPPGSNLPPTHVHAHSQWHRGFSTWQTNIDLHRFPVSDDWECWRLITGDCLIVCVCGFVCMLFCVFPSKCVNDAKEKRFYKVLDNCRPPTPNAMV